MSIGDVGVGVEGRIEMVVVLGELWLALTRVRRQARRKSARAAVPGSSASCSSFQSFVRSLVYDTKEYMYTIHCARATASGTRMCERRWLTLRPHVLRNTHYSPSFSRWLGFKA